MDWAFDDLLMGDFQISPSPPNSMSQESSSITIDNKDDVVLANEESASTKGEDNEPTSQTVTNSTSILAPNEASCNRESSSPDYVSELHQLLSEEDDEEGHNNLETENKAQLQCKQQSIHPNQDIVEHSFPIPLTNGKIARTDDMINFENVNSVIGSPFLPLLLSPPPAYKDDVCEISINDPSILSKTATSNINMAISKVASIDKYIHPVMSVQKTPLPSQVSGASIGGNATISVGDTFLTISTSSVMSTLLPAPPPLSQSSPHPIFPTLPFSITRLPGAIASSTTIKPTKSASNGFSFLPLTPVTVPSVSTANSSNNSPLLLQALAPQTNVNNVSIIPSPQQSRCSITPMTSFSADTDTERDSDMKRLKSQTFLSSINERLWPNNTEKVLLEKETIKTVQVSSTPLSVEPQNPLQLSSLLPFNISLPVIPIKSSLKDSVSRESSTFTSSDSLKILPVITVNTGPPTGNDVRIKTNNKYRDGNSKKENERDPNFEAASILAKSLEALQNSAKPQPGESSADLMNALTLSILPVQDDLIDRQQPPSTTCAPTPSSDLSLYGRNFVSGTQYLANNIYTNTVSAKCPSSVLSTELGNAGTISIRPIWKEDISIGVENNSKTAWDSAVVAQLGTLKPCAPPPSVLQGTAKNNDMTKSLVPPNTSVELPPHTPITQPAINLPAVASPPQCSSSLTPPATPTMFQSSALLNEDKTCSVPLSPQQPFLLSSTILPPPPYPSTSGSCNNTIGYNKTSSSSPHGAKNAAAMSEADSGVS